MSSHRGPIAALALVVALLAVMPGSSAAAAPQRSDDPTPTPAPAPAFLSEGRTPLQSALLRTIAERKAQGLPVPSGVTFEFTQEAGPGPTGMTPQGAKPGQQVTYVGRTTLHFDNPAQAGRSEWPALIVAGQLPPGATGTFLAGDYTAQVRAKVEEQLPGIWSRVTFGQEARTCTYTEHITVTENSASGTGAIPAPALPQSDETLLGFTIVGPNISYVIDECLEVLAVDVACFRAGFEFDYGLGLRLPMQIGITGMEPMLEGSTYTGGTSALGVDWATERYGAAGVPAESGNEFVMRLLVFAGVHLDVIGIDVVDFGINVDENHSRSFASPFGPGATFDLPSVNVPVWGKDLGIAEMEVGVQLTPRLGSDRLDALWSVSGEGTGGGSLSYSNPASTLPLSPIVAVDGPGTANLKLDEFEYYFTNFQLDLALYLYLDVFVTDVTITFGLPGVDLSAITQDLCVGPHSGTPAAVTAAVAIENVAPTAVIDRSGAMLIQGVPTFFAEKGVPLTFSGRATDPGRDDLTLTWDWDDGLPLPDVSTTYPVPHDVTESQTHAFDAACLHNVALEAMDDDAAVARDRVPVLIAPVERQLARLEGYWQHQLRQYGAKDYDVATLECMLEVVAHASRVFSETRDISTVAKAYDVVFMKGNEGSALEQLDRELLVAWLNFTSGTFRYQELLDPDGDGTADVTFAAHMDAVEQRRLDPALNEGMVRRETADLHALNVSRVATLPLAEYSAEERPADTRGASLPVTADESAAGEIRGVRCARTFSGDLDIAFSLGKAGDVRLSIYDVSGRRVWSLDGAYAPGTHRVVWNGTRESGQAMGNGVYFVVLQKEGQLSRTKGILMR